MREGSKLILEIKKLLKKRLSDTREAPLNITNHLKDLRFKERAPRLRPFSTFCHIYRVHFDSDGISGAACAATVGVV